MKTIFDFFFLSVLKNKVNSKRHENRIYVFKTPTNEATCCCYFHIQNLVFKKVGLKMLKIIVKKTFKSVVLNT